MATASGAIHLHVRVASMVLLALLLVGCRKHASPPPPPEVLVLTLAPTNVAIHQEWVATLEGYVNAEIRAQVTGYLLTQNYREGSRVSKGDLLFEIDPRPFQAVLNQAQGKLAQDKAQLAKTQLDVKRYTPLAKDQALSQETLDDAIQANRSALAQVESDEAAVESARLNLGFTRITAPIDGLAGTAQAQIGNLATPAGPVLTTVSTLDPIRAYFQVNEQSYLTFWLPFATAQNTNQPLALELVLSDGTVYPHAGRFFYADREINPTTGTLQIVGLFPNPEYMLRPGQYGLVRAQTELRTNAIVVPQRAVMESQGTFQAVVVSRDNKAQIKSVKLGAQLGSQWLVEEGLSAGDRLIVEGTQKAKAGTTVVPKPVGSTSDGNAMVKSDP